MGRRPPTGGRRPLIQDDNVAIRCRRGERRSQVSFVVTEAECVALLGANGDGTSLVIEALAMATRIASGSAQVAGVDVRRKPREARNRIGYVAETPLFPHQTDVAKCMKAMAASHRLPREDRADAQRVELARARACPQCQ